MFLKTCEVRNRLCINRILIYRSALSNFTVWWAVLKQNTRWQQFGDGLSCFRAKRCSRICFWKHLKQEIGYAFPHCTVQTMNTPLRWMIHCCSIWCTRCHLCCGSVPCPRWHHTRILLEAIGTCDGGSMPLCGPWLVRCSRTCLCAASRASRRSRGAPSCLLMLESDKRGWMHHAHQLQMLACLAIGHS